MSKRKGMSADDKRKVILNVYHDKKEPFNLKEMENAASKLGVVQQTIKDMNQSLVDDFLVSSKVYQDKKNEQEKIANQIARCKAAVIENKNNIIQQTEARCATGRREKMARYEELLLEDKELDSTLLAGRSNDPEEVNRVMKQANANMEHANRWTDNMWTVKKFLTSKKGMSGKEADQMLKINATFDYVTNADLPKEAKGVKRSNGR